MSATIEVVVHALNVRSGPSTNYSVSHALGQGQQAVVDNFVYYSWLHITVPFDGYLYAGTPSVPNVRPINISIPTPPSPTDFLVQAITDLNVRSQPSVSGNAPLTYVKAGTILHAESVQNGWYKLAGVQQFVSADPRYSKVVSSTPTSPPTTPTPPSIPPGQPNLPWNLPFTATQRGVHASAGGWRPSPSELNLVRDNHIETVLIVAYEPAQAGPAIRDFHNNGVSHFIFRASTHEKPTSVQRFLDITLPILKEYRDALGTSENMMIAIHNEPNLYSEGLGSGWSNGAQFATWWAGVAAVYRSIFPGCKLGFPAVSGGGAVAGIRVDETQFVKEAAAAVRAADWGGVHDYWQQDLGQDFNPPITLWRQMYGNKPLVGTEIGPVNAGVVTGDAVLKAYQKMAAVGIPTMGWILNGTGAFDKADWTKHPFKLSNPNEPPAQPSMPTPPPVQEGTKRTSSVFSFQVVGEAGNNTPRLLRLLSDMKTFGKPVKSIKLTKNGWDSQLTVAKCKETDPDIEVTVRRYDATWEDRVNRLARQGSFPNGWWNQADMRQIGYDWLIDYNHLYIEGEPDTKLAKYHQVICEPDYGRGIASFWMGCMDAADKLKINLTLLCFGSGRPALTREGKSDSYIWGTLYDVLRRGKARGDVLGLDAYVNKQNLDNWTEPYEIQRWKDIYADFPADLKDMPLYFLEYGDEKSLKRGADHFVQNLGKAEVILSSGPCKNAYLWTVGDGGDSDWTQDRIDGAFDQIEDYLKCY